jgi:hypothetical protein
MYMKIRHHHRESTSKTSDLVCANTAVCVLPPSAQIPETSEVAKADEHNLLSRLHSTRLPTDMYARNRYVIASLPLCTSVHTHTKNLAIVDVENVGMTEKSSKNREA